ncbi:unnamed protein product [Boreogadus saida]
MHAPPSYICSTSPSPSSGVPQVLSCSAPPPTLRATVNVASVEAGLRCRGGGGGSRDPSRRFLCAVGVVVWLSVSFVVEGLL